MRERDRERQRERQGVGGGRGGGRWGHSEDEGREQQKVEMDFFVYSTDPVLPAILLIFLIPRALFHDFCSEFSSHFLHLSSLFLATLLFPLFPLD